MRSLLGILTLGFLALFAGIWIWIGWDLWHFTATEQHPKLDLSDAVVSVAGFIASAVAAGTASVLGIEIQKVDSGNTLAARVSKAATDTKLLTLGILVYAGVGAFVLLVWIGHSEQAPDLLGAFSLGVLGWFAGAFAAVFRKTT